MTNGQDLWEYGGVLGGQSVCLSLPQQTTGDGVLGRFKVRFSMTLFGGRFRTLERGTSFPVTEATERAPRNCKSDASLQPCILTGNRSMAMCFSLIL